MSCNRRQLSVMGSEHQKTRFSIITYISLCMYGMDHQTWFNLISFITINRIKLALGCWRVSASGANTPQSISESLTDNLPVGSYCQKGRPNSTVCRVNLSQKFRVRKVWMKGLLGGQLEWPVGKWDVMRLTLVDRIRFGMLVQFVPRVFLSEDFNPNLLISQLTTHFFRSFFTHSSHSRHLPHPSSRGVHHHLFGLDVGDPHPSYPHNHTKLYVTFLCIYIYSLFQ